MKAEHFVALGIRLFSIVVVLYAFREGISSLSYYDSGMTEGFYPYFFAGLMLVMLFVATILWRFPMTIAHNILSFRQEEESVSTSINASQLQIVGFTLLGFYLLTRVLSTAVSWLIVWIVTQRSHTPLHLTQGQSAGLIATGAELAFALFLILGAGRLDRFLSCRR